MQYRTNEIMQHQVTLCLAAATLDQRGVIRRACLWDDNSASGLAQALTGAWQSDDDVIAMLDADEQWQVANPDDITQ